MNSSEARRTILAKTNEVVALARRLFPSYTHAAPTVDFNLRGRSCGGKAYGYTKLQFNLDWYEAAPEDYLNNTVTHEVAHIVASATGLGRGHNAGWIRICLALGGDGQRCGTHEELKGITPARRTNEYLYHTVCGSDAWVGPVHHARLQKRGGFIDHAGRPAYALRTASGGRILKAGFQGRTRVKA